MQSKPKHNIARTPARQRGAAGRYKTYRNPNTVVTLQQGEDELKEIENGIK
jgi:hypothetical protein